jgi:hypothetical protein
MRSIPGSALPLAVLALLSCLSCGSKPSATKPENISRATEVGSYYSDTCHYHIEYPQGILVTSSGDSAEFESRDKLFKGRVTCSTDESATPASQIQLRIKARPAPFQVAFKTVKSDLYAYSGTSNSIIYYEKAVFTGGNHNVVLSMEYPLASKAQFDSLVTKFSNSFEEYEVFDGVVSTVLPELNEIDFSDHDPDAQNILSTACKYNKSEAERFAAIMEGQEIRVGGTMHYVNYRKDPNIAQGGIYRPELWNCVLMAVVASPPQ